MTRQLRTLAAAFLAGFIVLAPRLSAAQDESLAGKPQAPVVTPLNSHFIAPCAPNPALALCLEEGQEGVTTPESILGIEPPKTAGRAPITGFAHLAGMFMGRVNMATLGAWRLRLKLSLD